MQFVRTRYCVWRSKQPSRPLYCIFLIKGCIFRSWKNTTYFLYIWLWSESALCSAPAMLLTNELFHSYFKSMFLPGSVEFLNNSQNCTTWLLLNSINQMIIQRGERLYNILGTLLCHSNEYIPTLLLIPDLQGSFSKSFQNFPDEKSHDLHKLFKKKDKRRKFWGK